MAFLSRLEEISIGKQIRNELEKCTYERLYGIATSSPKEGKYHSSPFHPSNVIHSILSPSASGREAAEEYIDQRKRTLAREIISKKYPNRKQPIQIGDYL